jgi:hypothetical protein
VTVGSGPFRWRVKYPNVKNAHIVRRFHVDGFSREGRIAVHVDHSDANYLQL